MIKVLQDWSDRCAELMLRVNDARVEYERCIAVHTRALHDEPRVCYNCALRREDGKCGLFGEHPPHNFQETPNACDKWEVVVPF